MKGSCNSRYARLVAAFSASAFALLAIITIQANEARDITGRLTNGMPIEQVTPMKNRVRLHRAASLRRGVKVCERVNDVSTERDCTMRPLDSKKR